MTVIVEFMSATGLAVPHGFFTRRGGVSSGPFASLNCALSGKDSRDNVLENRARAARAIDVDPARLVGIHQVHGADVTHVTEPWTPGNGPRADAMVTDRPGIALGIVTGDCAPVLFADPHAGVVGAAHAGWRGALSGVVEATITAMERLGAARERIRAALGPMIRQPNYEVGSDLMDRYAAEDPSSRAFFVPASRPDHALFDLPGYIAERLHRAGIRHVGDVGLCTYADPSLFFSYRRATHRAESDYGRHVNAIALTGE
jgi:polyphenol oxidase